MHRRNQQFHLHLPRVICFLFSLFSLAIVDCCCCCAVTKEKGVKQRSIIVYWIPECVCLTGFTGIPSDGCVNIDDCLSNPCQNNGTCNNLINGYECVCSPGFTGKDCDININECESNPCQNNGACIDGNAIYFCICLAGFTGLRCEINIDDNLIGRYFCNCTEDFVGVDCENPRVVTCANEPCLNSANCTDLRLIDFAGQ